MEKIGINYVAMQRERLQTATLRCAHESERRFSDQDGPLTRRRIRHQIKFSLMVGAMIRYWGKHAERSPHLLQRFSATRRRQRTSETAPLVLSPESSSLPIKAVTAYFILRRFASRGTKEPITRRIIAGMVCSSPCSPPGAKPEPSGQPGWCAACRRKKSVCLRDGHSPCQHIGQRHT